MLIHPHFITYLIKLKCTRTFERHYSHAPFVNSFLCALIAHPLPDLHANPRPEWIAIPFPVESGHVSYEIGDFYNIVVTLTGRNLPGLDYLVSRLDDLLVEGNRKGNRPADFPFEPESIFPLPPADLETEVEPLSGLKEISLRFITPLEIEQKFPDAESRYFSPDYFDLDHFFITLDRRLHDLSRLAGYEPGKWERPELPDLELTGKHLIWINIPARENDYNSPNYYGVMGKITLQGKLGAWAEKLALGQYYHLGRHINFGLGKYRIDSLTNQISLSIAPAQSLLQKTALFQNLRQAFLYIKANAGGPGVDHESIDDFETCLSSRLEQLNQDLQNNKYTSQPLLGIVMEYPDGRRRALAIPTVTDRIAQKAAAQIIGPSVDNILEECSCAYRKGRSRLTAKREIEQAYTDGYTHVFKADIDDFFDNVHWEILINKLEALYPHDQIIDLISQWITSPVIYQGKKIHRTKGLPQGSPISPLLANLYLDEFDEEMEKLGFKLIRYADDFVILCKNAQEAHAAEEASKKALGELELKLNQQKVKLTDFDYGFRYLGYLFWRSLVLESKDDAHHAPLAAAQDLGEISKSSWLAAFRKEKRDDSEKRERIVSLADLPDTFAVMDKAPVYLDSPDLQARTSRGRLLIGNLEDEELADIPFERISHLIVIGRTRITMPAVLNASRHGIPVYFLRRSGQLYSSLNPNEANWHLWQAQAELLKDKDRCLEFSRRIVEAKLNNQATVLKNREIDEVSDEIKAILSLKKSSEFADNIPSLLGLEGKGAAYYFKALQKIIEPAWGFHERVKHPPTDPVNSLLSLGYSLLYNHCATFLQIYGLNPALGIFHTPRESYLALAADMQEEFRHLIDSLVLRLIRKREIHPDDFFFDEKRSICLLNNEIRKKYMAAIEDRLKQRFTYKPEIEPISYRDFIGHQASQIKAFIEGKIKNYQPLKIR